MKSRLRTEDTIQRVVWHYHRAKWDRFRKDLAAQNWASMMRCGPSAAELYSSTICNLMARHIPHSTITNKPGNQPWFNEECRRASQEQHQAYLKIRCQPGEAATQDYMHAKQRKQHAIDRAKRFHNQRIRSKLCSPATSSREWWWTIKQLMGAGGSANIPILNDGGVQHVSAKDKAEAFATIFSQKCRVDDPSRPPADIPTITEARHQPIRFTPRDIKKRPSALDTAKAIGPDNIPAVALKTCAAELAAPLAKLFQYSYNTGIYPTMWKIAEVCPAFCGRDKSNPANYRPISLLSIFSKVMEGVVKSAIKRHLGSVWVPPRPLGSRPQYSLGPNMDKRAEFQR
ncbi:uncharacterized protein [Heptranchias perlo]|uniref:uncharacterized protein n=1 Tax=Heptranchias perlo TaxID=212740 RepID=UPI003559AEA4